MTGAALQLLGHGVDVAETALQRMIVEDRGRAGGIVGEVDGFASAVDRMCRGHADDDALLDRDQGAGAEMLPDLGHRLQEIGAGGTQIDFRLCKACLHHRIVSDRAFVATRYLALGEFEEAVERPAGDAAGYPRKTHLIAGAVAHAIEGAVLAALAIELARDRVIRSHEEVIQRELIAGGAAQAHRVPDVGPLDVLAAHQHGALLLLAAGLAPRRSVRRIDRAMRTDPGRMPPA